MTTIAFDGKVLAADRGLTSAGCIVVSPESKIVLGAERAAMMTGALSELHQLAVWWIDGAAGDPPKDLDENGCLIGCERALHRIVYIDTHGRTLWMPAPYAEGSGAQLAIGAMSAGATAIEAVRIACNLDPKSRGPIDYVVASEDPWVIHQVSAERDAPPSLRVVGA